MPPVGFEPTIPAGERPQTYALNRAATGRLSTESQSTDYIKSSISTPLESRGIRLRICLSHCAKSHKISGSIPDVVNGILY